MKKLKTQDFDDKAPRTEEETREALQKLVEECDPEVWEAALRCAKKVRSKSPASELGRWTDFELGMLIGKYSALRWALGDDWDWLDNWLDT